MPELVIPARFRGPSGSGNGGRKLTAGSALLGPGGEVLAVARTVWVTVPRPVPAGAS